MSLGQAGWETTATSGALGWRWTGDGAGPGLGVSRRNAHGNVPGCPKGARGEQRKGQRRGGCLRRGGITAHQSSHPWQKPPRDSLR